MMLAKLVLVSVIGAVFAQEDAALDPTIETAANDVAIDPTIETAANDVAILNENRSVDVSGKYGFGFAAEDGTARIEEKDDDGEVRGQYQYVDADGETVIVRYTAGKNGFVVESPVLPKAPKAFPTIAPQPAPQQIVSRHSRSGSLQRQQITTQHQQIAPPQQAQALQEFRDPQQIQREVHQLLQASRARLPQQRPLFQNPQPQLLQQQPQFRAPQPQQLQQPRAQFRAPRPQRRQFQPKRQQFQPQPQQFRPQPQQFQPPRAPPAPRQFAQPPKQSQFQQALAAAQQFQQQPPQQRLRQVPQQPPQQLLQQLPQQVPLPDIPNLRDFPVPPRQQLQGFQVPRQPFRASRRVQAPQQRFQAPQQRFQAPQQRSQAPQQRFQAPQQQFARGPQRFVQQQQAPATAAPPALSSRFPAGIDPRACPYYPICPNQ